MDLLVGVFINLVISILMYVLAGSLYGALHPVIGYVLLLLFIILMVYVNIKIADRYERKMIMMTIQGAISVITLLIVVNYLSDWFISTPLENIYTFSIIPAHIISAIINEYYLEKKRAEKRGESYWSK